MSKSKISDTNSALSSFQNVSFNNKQSENKQNKKKHYGIGVDFGTSNSAAAIFDGNQVKLVKLEQHSHTMPSANYIDKGFVTTTGQTAIDQYINSNRGRKVELSLEVLGESRSTTGQIDAESRLPTTASTNLLYGQAFNDGSLPGRLFRGTKRLLGSAGKQRIMIFNRPFRLVALITPIILRIQQSIAQTIKSENKTKNDANHACIGHPVNFEGHNKDHNQIAMNCLSESYRHAGITKQFFYPEPVAAAVSYLLANPDNENKTGRVLTVDFGGGTLDLCILHRQDAAFKVEAIHGIGLGGDKIDQTVYRKLLFPLLGRGERWSRTIDGYHVDTLFPFEEYEDLLINWPVSYMLNQNEYTTAVIDRMQQSNQAAGKFKRLYELITQNYSYQVFQAIKDLKVTLSTKPSALLDIPEIDVEVKVSREEFETMIADLLFEFEEAMMFTLKKAKLNPTDINLVLRTGGSSLIPAVKQILDQHFPDKVVEHDPFTSVAAGLAIADYFGYGIKETTALTK